MMALRARFIDMLPRLQSRAIRAAPIFVSYLIASAVLLVSIWALNSRIDANLLQSFLVFVLVNTIAAGLEPGTAKAWLLTRPQLEEASSIGMLAASAFKAMLISLPLAFIWYFSEGSGRVPIEITVTPLLAILGFAATDLRVILDSQGRHVAAIWLKQGSLSLAIAISAISLALGHDLFIGILASCLARLVWTVLFWKLSGTSSQTRESFSTHIFHFKWMQFLLASCIGALSASIDRIIALRILEPKHASSYMISYEVLTKFWLFPYLLTPLLFVQAINHGPYNKSTKFSYIILACAGIPFLIFSAVIPLLPLEIFQQSQLASWGLFIFALAILITAFNQILSIELQASGAAASATNSAVVGLISAAIAFPLLLTYAGVNGLFFAWLLKSLAEGAVLMAGTIKGRRV